MVRNATLEAAGGTNLSSGYRGDGQALYDVWGKYLFSRVGKTMTVDAGISYKPTYLFDNGTDVSTTTLVGSGVTRSSESRAAINGISEGVPAKNRTGGFLYEARKDDKYTFFKDMYNGALRNRRFSQTLYLGMRGRIAEVVEVRTSNSFRWHLLWPNVSGIDRFGFISNISLGYRLGKKRNVTLTAEGYDLFDKRQRTIESLLADNVYTSYENLTHRHVILRAEWKF